MARSAVCWIFLLYSAFHNWACVICFFFCCCWPWTIEWDLMKEHWPKMWSLTTVRSITNKWRLRKPWVWGKFATFREAALLGKLPVLCITIWHSFTVTLPVQIMCSLFMRTSYYSFLKIKKQLSWDCLGASILNALNTDTGSVEISGGSKAHFLFGCKWQEHLLPRWQDQREVYNSGDSFFWLPCKHHQVSRAFYPFLNKQ